MLWFVSGFILAMWVSIDCGSSGQNWLFWSIVVFFFNLPGLIFYYLVTRMNIGPGPKRRGLVLRDKDDELRKKYTQGKMGLVDRTGMPVYKGAMPEPVPDFLDPKIEDMIAEGRTSEVVRYIEDLKAVAREMDDKKLLANLKKYEARVALHSGTLEGKAED